MASSKFWVESKTLTEMHDLGFSLRNILQILKLNGCQDEFGFFIKSDSTKTAVRLLNDASIFDTYQFHCKAEEVVTIIVRPRNDPSPDYARAPSAPASGRVRHRIIDSESPQDHHHGKTSKFCGTIVKNVRSQLLKACRG